MEVRFANGATIHRMWSSGPELLAVFQYVSDAKDFARALVERDVRQKLPADYAVTDSGNGKMEVFYGQTEGVK